MKFIRTNDFESFKSAAAKFIIKRTVEYTCTVLDQTNQNVSKILEQVQKKLYDLYTTTS